MTLTVECSEVLLAQARMQPVEIGGDLRWSQTLSSAGTTTNSAPAPNQANRVLVFTCSPEVNGWVSIGPTPDASNATLRRRLLAFSQRTFLAPVGARVAWIPG